MNTNDIHSIILDRAAKIANADPRLPEEVTSKGTVPFFDANWRTAGDYLTLGFVQGILEPIEDPERKQAVQETMRQIGVEAVKSSIVQNKELFVGMMLGEAKQGRQYFERFRTGRD